MRGVAGRVSDLIEENDDGFTLTATPTGAQVLGVRSAGEKLIARSQGSVTISLKGATRPDSQLLSLLLCWLRVAMTRGTTLHFSHLSPELQAMAQLSGLQRLHPSFAPSSQQS